MLFRTALNFLCARRLELIGVLLSLFVSVLFVPQVLHFSHRYDAIRSTSGSLPMWQSLEELELRLYDARFTARGIKKPKSRDKIAIIGIDQLTLNALGKWPYPRKWHAQVIQRLHKAGAKSVFIDVDFSARTNIEDDAALSTAVAKAKNVFLPSFLEREIKSVDVQKMEHTQRTTVNATVQPLSQTGYDDFFLTPEGKFRKNRTPEEIRAYRTYVGLGLEEQTPEPCLISVRYDFDNRLRTYPIRTSLWGGDENLGSAAVASTGLYNKLLDGEENLGYEKALRTAIWPTSEGKLVPIPLLSSKQEADDAPHTVFTLIDFWGPPSNDSTGTFPKYSYSDVRRFRTKTILRTDDVNTPAVLNKKEQWQWHGFSDAQMKEKFGGRMVFIGATATILGDVFQMPQFNSLDIKGKTQRIPGVEIHATLAAMLLDGVYLRQVSTQSTFFTLFGLSAFSSLWLTLLHNSTSRLARSAQYHWARWGAPGRVHALVWFLWSGFIAVLPLVCFWEAAKWFFNHHNLWVIVVYPALSAALSSSAVLILLYGTESAERRKTVAQFGRFMSPAIMEEVLAHPEEDYPRPRRAYATVLFTDLEGFTSYTETHDAEHVVEALNSYMTRMIPIVQSYGGTVDKYIGDAIMAYFGVPIPYDDHAKRALRCAIEMQEECAKFREDTGIEFYMRIGVHTGDIIAGSMGSEGNEKSQPMLNYTVIGDTVNLASRLEGKNKDLGSWILCSADTYEAAQQLVLAESASAQIKGKSQTVDVYKVRGLVGHPPCDGRWGHL